VRSRRLLGFGARSVSEGFLGCLRATAATPSPRSPASRSELGRRLERTVAVLGLGLLLQWDPTGAADESSIELVDIAGV